MIKPLCASLEHFTLHAGQCAGGLDARAREALIKYVLRPPLAQERVTAGPASASKLRSRVVPSPPAAAPASDVEASKPDKPGCRYRTWTELLATLGIDALACPKCAGRMRVLALVREAHDIKRTLQAMGEATVAPARAPARGPPF